VAGLAVLLAVCVTATAAALPGCRSCHDSADFVAQTRAHSHATVDCVRCHVSGGVPARLTYGFNIVFAMTLRITPTSAGQTTAVADAACLSCHRGVMQRKVTANELSILHEQCTKGRRCTDCHADTAHGSAVSWITTVNMNQCIDCHSAQRVRSNCDTCHGKRSEKERIDSGEWQRTHGPNWRQTHGMGDLKTCASCHPDDYCVRCHGLPLPHNRNFVRSHPALAIKQRDDCAVCHQQKFCDSCHGMPMPHPVGFTPKHASIVGKQGKTVCLRCHAEDDCTNCHVRHVHPGGAVTPPESGAQ